MTWENLCELEIPLKEIFEVSSEYDALHDAAHNGNPKAQYYFGLWKLLKSDSEDEAREWLSKAAKQGSEEAKEALSQLNDGSLRLTDKIKVVDGDANVNNRNKTLVIQEHDFQEAKNSLIKYANEKTKTVEISRVPNDGWFFHLGDHFVKGHELNGIIREVQGILKDFNKLCIGLVDEFGVVYKTFEALDRDYISAIVTSVKALEKVSENEQKDRKEIRKLVHHHENVVDVLIKFKENIEKLSKLATVNDEWEAKSKLIDECNEYIDKLRNLKHILEIDALWANTQSVSNDVRNLKQNISSRFEKIEEKQREFRTEFYQVKKDQNDKLEAAKKELSGNIESAIEKQEASIQNFKEDQSRRIDELSAEQTSKLEDMSNRQISALEQIATEQTKKMNVIHESLEEEKSALNDKVAVLKQKIVYLYIVAGGATALTLVQLILNILDII